MHTAYYKPEHLPLKIGNHQLREPKEKTLIFFYMTQFMKVVRAAETELGLDTNYLISSERGKIRERE